MTTAHQPAPPTLDGTLRIGDSIRRSSDRHGLTDAEHRFMALTGELMDLFVHEVCFRGAARQSDISEMAARIHAIQYPVLAQAAARAHPSLYRLLGRELDAN